MQDTRTPFNKLKDAVTDSRFTQADYTGKVTQKEIVTIHDEDGTPIHTELDVVISYNTIVKIMAMIRRKAGLEE